MMPPIGNYLCLTWLPLRLFEEVRPQSHFELTLDGNTKLVQLVFGYIIVQILLVTGIPNVHSVAHSILTALKYFKV